MSHANARLTVHGRLLLVLRVVRDGRPVAHVARELGVSRQCAHRWVARYLCEGEAGLRDRSSRPHRMPSATSVKVETRVLAARAKLRAGRDVVAAATKVPARTVSRILARHGVPRLAECDPITGLPIRASRVTTCRYERDHPGDLIHVDVKKLGKIPPGGGWRVHGRAVTTADKHKRPKIGFDYVHAAVDDHSRLAYAEILPDEKGPTTAEFVLRAAAWFAAHGITVREVITDNAFNYVHSRDFAAAIEAIGAKHRRIRPHCPWQNGKVERFNRTLALEWAYRRPFASNAARARALAPWLKTYNTQRGHHALGGQPPISRVVSPT
ncbi:IS481 family transposase [Spongisporangium articulatum]|uniref:IS481 family transposase n=1 Tax=Spongisporangium articulatum TaxID=3362603 RepID=A0ABW8AU80_9ACTN